MELTVFPKRIKANEMVLIFARLNDRNMRFCIQVNVNYLSWTGDTLHAVIAEFK